MHLYLIAENEPFTEYRPPLTVKPTNSKLQLRYNGKTRTVSDQRPECVIGRVEDCDLVVTHSLVSRHHAIIDCKLGKYFLQDQSTNGTYVMDDGSADVIVLQREFVQLKGKGTISLGIHPNKDPEHCIEFEEIS